MTRALTLAVLVLALAGCASQQGDDTGWRTQVQSVLGHPVPDWKAYRAHAQDRCRLEPDAFQQALSREAHGRAWYAIQVDLTRACPGRIQEADEWEQSHGPAG